MKYFWNRWKKLDFTFFSKVKKTFQNRWKKWVSWQVSGALFLLRKWEKVTKKVEKPLKKNFKKFWTFLKVFKKKLKIDEIFHFLSTLSLVAIRKSYFCYQSMCFVIVMTHFVIVMMKVVDLMSKVVKNMFYDAIYRVYPPPHLCHSKQRKVYKKKLLDSKGLLWCFCCCFYSKKIMKMYTQKSSKTIDFYQFRSIWTSISSILNICHRKPWSLQIPTSFKNMLNRGPEDCQKEF